MIRSVLVPVDGSAFGEQAIPLALGLARRAGARLEIVLVHVPYVPVESISDYPESIDRDVLFRERDYLQALRERLEKSAGIPVNKHHPRGLIADTLEEQVAKAEADLVVMATHGRGPLSRLWLGSVADAMIRRLPVPVVLVRPQDEHPPHPTGEQVCRHILIPLDGSTLAESVLKAALNLGEVMDARYTLLRVVSPPSAWPPHHEPGRVAYDPLIRKAEAKAQDYLDGVADNLRERGLNVQTRVAIGLKPAPVILSEATAAGADLIALATHGRGRLPRIILGSVADKVVRGASTPVLVFRAPA
jgi:nucleotide-binding universal stress UspA family protein